MSPDAIVCVSTSGRLFKSFEQRSEVLDLDGELKPDMASLTLGSMNFPKQASVNEPSMIAGLAEKMRARGIVPDVVLKPEGSGGRAPISEAALPGHLQGEAEAFEGDNAGDVLLAGPAVRAAASTGRPVHVLCGPRGRAAADLLPASRG